ncbi:MAG: hypothetical protein H6Q58_605 [Firmicutes bacterium]|nr:hypothetical protein [Bacillota bacterium]
MIYLVILGVMFIFAFLDVCEEEVFPKYRYIFLAFFFMFLFLFAGLRYEVGYDFYSYRDIFRVVDLTNLTKLDLEIGYTAFNLILKTMGFGFQVVLILIAAFSLFFKYEAIRKYSIYPFISLIIYFSSNFIIQDFGQIRQGLAIAMTLYSIGAIKDRKLFRFFAMMTIAVSFHYSAILFVPFYWLGNIKLSYRKMGIILAASVILYIAIVLGGIEFVFTHVIRSEYILYKFKAYSGDPIGFFTFTFMFRVFIFAAFVALEEKIRPACKYYDILRNGYFMAIIFYIVFNTNEGLATRGALYYKMFEVFLIPYIVYGVKDKLLVFNAIMIFYLYTIKDVIGAVFGRADQFSPYNNVILELIKKGFSQ